MLISLNLEFENDSIFIEGTPIYLTLQIIALKSAINISATISFEIFFSKKKHFCIQIFQLNANLLILMFAADFSVIILFCVYSTWMLFMFEITSYTYMVWKQKMASLNG